MTIVGGHSINDAHESHDVTHILNASSISSISMNTLIDLVRLSGDFVGPYDNRLPAHFLEFLEAQHGRTRGAHH